MSYAAAYLAQYYEVYFYDALAVKHRFDTFYKVVEDIKPDITVIETSTPSIEFME